MTEEEYKKEWDRGIQEISNEMIAQFDDWKEDTETINLMDYYEDGEMDEDTYYNLISSMQSAQDSSAYDRPLMSSPSIDVVEEPVAEFSLSDDDQ